MQVAIARAGTSRDKEPGTVGAPEIPKEPVLAVSESKEKGDEETHDK